MQDVSLTMEEMEWIRAELVKIKDPNKKDGGYDPWGKLFIKILDAIDAENQEKMVYIIIDLLNPKDLQAFSVKANAERALSDLQDDVDSDHKWALVEVTEDV